MDTGLDNANNHSVINSNGSDFKHNGQEYKLPPFFSFPEKSNGKRLASEFEDDDDLGPETNVDAVDDLLSPSFVAAKALADGFGNNNPEGGNFNPFLEKCEGVEKASLELDLDLEKQQSREFDGERSPREETPTPPADTVHDGGLVDHLGDSGEESEDEWNYIKGEEANKENVNSSQPDEEAEIDLEETDMSQLNPNAAEFVPVSPTRSIPSPACRALLNDHVLAESPKRATEIDINLPNPQDFEKEVKSRPSDFDSLNNGHDAESDQKTVDLMENLLNGKNIDEIPEFQPGNTPQKNNSAAVGEEFHFGPNAAPFTPAKLVDQSGEISTTAVYGDDDIQVVGDFTLDNILSKDNVDFIGKGKEDDPMTMSFYQNEEDDLNKVRRLPDNLDDFLSSAENNVLSDELHSSRENKENEPIETNTRNISSDLFDNEQIITTDLDKVVVEEKELASPIASNEDDEVEDCGWCQPEPPQPDAFVRPLVCSLPKDAMPSNKEENDLEGKEIEADRYFCRFKPREKEIEEPITVEREEAVSPEPVILSVSTLEPELVTCLPELSSPERIVESPDFSSQELIVASPEPALAASPEPVQVVSSPEPELQVASPEPVIATSPALLAAALETERGVVSPHSESGISSAEPTSEILSSEPAVLIDSVPLILSPEPEKVATPEPAEEPILQSSRNETVQLEDTSQIVQENLENICELSRSPLPSSIESPIDEVTSSVKDIASPIGSSPTPDKQSEVAALVDLNFAHEINNAVIEEAIPQPVEQSSPIKEDLLIPEVSSGPGSTPKSLITDTESVATADVNSFLERSQISPLASPLSPGDQPFYNHEVMDLNHPLMRCVYPLPTDRIITEEPIVDEIQSEIKTEHIVPEIAVPVVLTPTPSTEEIKKTAPSISLDSSKKEKGAEGLVSKTTKATTTKAKTTPTPTKRTSTGLKSTTKPAAAAPKPRPSSSSTTPKTAPKPATTSASKLSSNLTKPATTKPTTKPIEKKPIMNGEVKRTSATKLTSTLTKPATSPSKPRVTSTTRPTSSPLKPATTTTTKPKPAATTTLKPTATKTSMVRPTTLSKSSTGNTTSSSNTTTRAATTAVAKTTAAARPASAPTKQRVPLSLRPTVTKTVEAEKQSKDSANKITASKSVASTRTTSGGTSRTNTSTLKKTEASKVGATRTTVTKTTSTTTRPPPITKKSATAARTATKTTTTKIEKPIQNGVTTVVTEKIIVNNETSELIKDPSPLDNKLIIDNTTGAD